MPIRMTGLTSGLDTESIVNALMSAQRTKKTKIENKKQKLEWKQEVWKSLNTKLYSFYKDSLSKMRFQSNYTTKKATSADNTKLTATATSSAAAGTYQVKIKSMAAAQYVTGAKVGGVKNSDGGLDAASAKTKLVDLCAADGSQSFTSGAKIKINGTKEVELEVSDSTTIDDLVSACKNAGLNATFDTKQQRIFLSSQKSGESNKFSIQVGDGSGGSVTGFTSQARQTLSNLKNTIGYSSLQEKHNDTDTTQVTTQSDIDDIINGLRSGGKISDTDKDTLKAASDTVASQKASSLYDAIVANQTLTDDENKAIEEADYTGMSDEEKAKAIADAKQAKKEEKATKLISDTYSDAAINGKDAAIAKLASEGTVSSDVDGNVDSSKLKALLGDSASTSKYGIESKKQRDKSIGDIVDTYNGLADAGQTSATYSNDTALKSLGLQSFDGNTEYTESGTDASTTAPGMVLTTAKSTEVVYNGATLTSDTTSVDVAGVTLNLLGTTQKAGTDGTSDDDYDTVNVTVSNDTSGVYDSIKEFITEYNSILSSMNTYYNAASASSYDVLTDDQKSAMSDDEVDKWNTKIKDSLLRRDSTLSSLISSVKTNLQGTVTASNGKRYSLANLGITTSAKNYNEGGLLHIKGDEDDTEFSDSTNTLKQMLEDDPDTVKEVLSGLVGNLYDDLTKKMGTSRLSSTLTFYNDKEMASQLSDYKTEISNWETKLSAMEERYYSQFTAMEKSLANLQSQQSSLSQYLS
ncbi:flagellar filament capping protein FliD [Eubacterium sp. MSJ-13]|uniref:flagellar filament capping protein FliD n=1 Tax=Eubacterium sp. MSJ-13 TaxID=2841513 RepID=UPI001C1096A2|nr:flagellar filament capping protein FliD [Eubacterium sp. MSJ-13]MBU5477767.1 flagellar filament capping protein FliD [Eubacterium sp. MSJ-13]